MAAADYIIVGSGINALVAAAQLGRKGHKVLVLERNDRIGGCIRTEEITAPGFIHDVMATTFVLFITSPAFAELGPELEKRGLAFAHSPTPTAVLMPDGRHAILSMDRKANVAAFDQLAAGDGARFAADVDRIGADAPFLFALLGGSLWSGAMLKIVAREAWRRGLRGLATYFGEALGTARAWLETRYQSDVMQALFAPWVLHTGLGPESAYSGQMGKVIAFALEVAGAPIVKGGAQELPRRLRAPDPRSGRRRARERRRGAGAARRRAAPRAACGSPAAARSRPPRVSSARSRPISSTAGLLADAALPADIKQSVSQYRYGKGNFQIHYALKAPPKWKAPELGGVALMHLTPGSTACRRPPTKPSAACCRRCRRSASDSRRRSIRAAARRASRSCGCSCRKRRASSRAMPRARSLLPADGKWTEAVREKYADRIEAILASHIDGFRDECDRAQGLFAGRPRNAQYQSGRRRSLWRLLRHRPVLPLAAVPRLDQPPHPGGAAPPHRRLDPSGSRPRRRFRLSGGEGIGLSPAVARRAARLSGAER